MRTQPSELISRHGPGELALLDRIRRRVTTRSRPGELSLGIGDDCALLRPRSGEEFAVTTDLSIAGRHFRLEWHPPEAVGHRTLARGLSDIAAMGARPLAAFLSLGLPSELTVAPRRSKSPKRSKSWIDGFLDGFLSLASKFDTPLAGGDLAESPVALADIVLVGAAPRGQALLRSGARPGDLLYVTGTLGGAAAGLDRLRNRAVQRSAVKKFRPSDTHSLSRHLYPQPRIAQGLWLRRRRAATAAIDISDGLTTDLDHLCVESGVSAELEARALPVHPEASLDQALIGGEDYELLFTASSRTSIPQAIAGVPVTRIGRIVKGYSGETRITLIAESGPRPLKRRGWEHFS